MPAGMARIVTTTYRYKPPPKRKGRKLAEITGPAVVTAKESSRRPAWKKAAAGEGMSKSTRLEKAGEAQPTTPPERQRDPVVITQKRRPRPTMTASRRPSPYAAAAGLPTRRRLVMRHYRAQRRLPKATAL